MVSPLSTTVLKSSRSGEAVGKVLRINTHMTSEAREQYARLCVQINVDKPFIIIVLIGKLKEHVLYKGIHKLCFGCGKVSHQRESYPFIVHGFKSPEMGVPKSHSVPVHDPRSRHDPSTSASSNSTVGDIQERDVQEGDYRPWLVVSRRRSGHKSPKNQSTWVDKAGPPLLARTSHATSMEPGPSKDYKQKLTVDPNHFGPNLSKLQPSGSTIQMDQANNSPRAGSTQPSLALGPQ